MNMKYLKSLFVRLLREEDGPTAVEYAVMIAGIFLAAIATIKTVGTSANQSFDTSSSAIENAIAS